MIVAAKDFQLAPTLESGQVFGFVREADNTFRGEVNGKGLRVLQTNGALKIDSPGISEAEIRNYFDLDRNLEPVYELLRADDCLRSSYDQFQGLRLIHQDPWHALAGFIISANNNVKRIQGIWQRLSASLGSSPFSFPTPKQISSSCESKLRTVGLGYRAPYLLETARQVSAKRSPFQNIGQASYDEGKELLQKYSGVGPKVADCVLLYGFQKFEAFPMDVWVLRTMRQFYFRNRKTNPKKIDALARRKWGALRGYVQQYLFHAARKKGVKT